MDEIGCVEAQKIEDYELHLVLRRLLLYLLGITFYPPTVWCILNMDLHLHLIYKRIEANKSH